MNDLNNHWYFPQIFIFFLAFLSSLSISSLSIYLIRHYCVVQSCRILARYKMFYKNNTSSTSLFRPFVHNISEDSKCGRIFRAYFHLLLICFYAGLRNNFSFFRKRHGKKTSLFSKQVGLSATRFHTFCTQKIRYFALPRVPTRLLSHVCKKLSENDKCVKQMKPGYHAPCIIRKIIKHLLGYTILTLQNEKHVIV